MTDRTRKPTIRHTLATLATSVGAILMAGTGAQAAGKLDVVCAQPLQTEEVRDLLAMPISETTVMNEETLRGYNMFVRELRHHSKERVEEMVLSDWAFRLEMTSGGVALMTDANAEEIDSLDLDSRRRHVAQINYSRNPEAFFRPTKTIPTHYFESVDAPGRYYKFQAATKNMPYLLYVREATSKEPIAYSTKIYTCAKTGS
ncbi:hypothetical protein [Kordiimonas sp.]|uniref:hypothetical protein n=1 Tax=Kordiimonas sp. TaxID=1970157 RepID=UPI003A902FD7